MRATVSLVQNKGDFYSVYGNEEVIAINQDSGFHPAVPFYRTGNGDDVPDVFEKKLEDGSFAYAFFRAKRSRRCSAVLPTKPTCTTFGPRKTSAARGTWIRSYSRTPCVF